MTAPARIPVDSADARELRELEEARKARPEDQPRPAIHDATCRDGWIGDDAAGRPIACPVCKPHLYDHRCMTCNLPQSRCAGQRAHVGQRCCNGCQHRIAAAGVDR